MTHPLKVAAHADIQDVRVDSPNASGASTGHESTHEILLIVEDEQMLLDAVTRMLRKQGYAVLTAADGDEAIDVVRNVATQIAVVILDVSLPGASSREVLLEVRNRHADAAVILTSAFDEFAFESSFEGLQVDGFIRKPFRLAALVDLIESKLSAR